MNEQEGMLHFWPSFPPISVSCQQRTIRFAIGKWVQDREQYVQRTRSQNKRSMALHEIAEQKLSDILSIGIHGLTAVFCSV
jgi:hypothetical protein